MTNPSERRRSEFTSCGDDIFPRHSFFISGTALRGKIVGLIGEATVPRRVSLMSLIGIIWLCRAYGQAEYIQLWGKLYMIRPVALIVMLAAFFFVALAFTSPNPTAVGGGVFLAESEPAKGIQRITRHPFLWGVGLWSLTHLTLNGDLASVVFFGSFLILAVGGPFSIDRKRKKAFGDAWNPIRRPDLRTSPFCNHQGPQLTKNRRDWLVACDFGGHSLRFVSSLSQEAFGVSPLPA